MKAFVEELALKFAPTFRSSEGERCYLVELENRKKPRILRAYPPWKPFVYFSALQLGTYEDYTAYEINYFTIWDWDIGVNGHQWDTERTAILVEGPHEEDVEAFFAKQAYYAAHEGAISDKSTFSTCKSKSCGVTVYWSLGKHASYPQKPTIFEFERFRDPGFESKPEEYTLVDMGTLENPKFPWMCYEEKWDPKKKCSSICRKLRTRLWTRSAFKSVKKRQPSTAQVKTFQEFVDLSPTGEVDEATIRAAKNMDLRLILNIEKFSKREFDNIRSSRMKGSDIDYIVKAKLSSSETKEVAQKGLYGTALRKYAKEKGLRHKIE